VKDRRRFLLILLAGVHAARLVADAQPASALRIGILANLPLDDPEGAPLWQAFIQGLRDLGYVEGQKVTLEWRVSEGKYERLPNLAAELVQRKVDLIVVPADQNAIAARRATQTIPIVMIGDPLGSGLATSLARPGGNVTGLSAIVGYEIVGKRLELLKATVPELSRVAVLRNPYNPGHVDGLKAAEAAARSLSLALKAWEARGPNDFGSAFAAMTQDRVGAVLVLGDGMFGLHRAKIADLAVKARLPTIHASMGMVLGGGFMSYGVSHPDLFRRAATYVDRIVKGARPGDLPIEQPTRFELVINLNTAKALGLTVPPSLLARADQLIE
jgi:putative tryptophan/tyrosine transport system substrate-binding protein